MSSLTDPKYRYNSAEESRKPGYLARKFAKLKREKQSDKRQAASNVTALPVEKKKAGAK